MDAYQKNLDYLATFNSALAEKLKKTPLEEGKVIPIETGGFLNILIKEPKDTYYLHDPSSPVQESNELLKQLNLNNIDVLYVYGIGSGYFYDAIKPWLDTHPHAFLVFLEDNLTVIYHFLKSAQATKILSDPQVELYDISQAQDNRSILRLITQDHMLRSSTLTALPSYLKHRSSNYSMLADLIAYETNEQNGRDQELAQFGIGFFSNFYRNLLCLPNAYMGSFLFHQFKNIPVIICGAGPSLEKQIPLMKELKNKALIIAPGSSINILSYHGLTPHFGMAVDPYSETFHRQIMHRAFETPIFYRNRVHYEALRAIHGPRLFLRGTPFYLITEWFEEQLGLISETIQDEGYNVVHTAIDLVKHLGCNPVIFVGLDLSLSEDKKFYSSGVERHPLFPPKKNPDHYYGPLSDQTHPVEVKDIHGQHVTSYWPWITEAQWISEYGLKNPDITFINATEGGIGLFSIENTPLKEAVDKHLVNDYPLEQIIHEKIQDADRVEVTQALVEQKIKVFQMSLKRCEAICISITEAIKQNVYESILTLESRYRAQLIQEAAYQYLLLQFEEFFLSFIKKDLRTLKRVKDPEEIEERQKQLLVERYQFLMQTVRLNLQIIDKALLEAKEQVMPLDASPIKPDQEVKENTRSTYASGAIYSTEHLQKDTNEKTVKCFFMDGTVKSEIHYLNDQLNGPVRLYYPNSQIKREIFFVDGKREGIERSWYETGQLFTEITYKANEAKHARCWLPNGTIAKDLEL